MSGQRMGGGPCPLQGLFHAGEALCRPVVKQGDKNEQRGRDQADGICHHNGLKGTVPGEYQPDPRDPDTADDSHKDGGVYRLLHILSVSVPDGVGDHHIGPQGDADDLPGRLNVGACFRPLSPPLQVSRALVWKRYAVLSKAAEVFLRQVGGG